MKQPAQVRKNQTYSNLRAPTQAYSNLKHIFHPAFPSPTWCVRPVDRPHNWEPFLHHFCTAFRNFALRFPLFPGFSIKNCTIALLAAGPTHCAPASIASKTTDRVTSTYSNFNPTYIQVKIPAIQVNPSEFFWRKPLPLCESGTGGPPEVAEGYGGLRRVTEGYGGLRRVTEG